MIIFHLLPDGCIPGALVLEQFGRRLCGLALHESGAPDPPPLVRSDGPSKFVGLSLFKASVGCWEEGCAAWDMVSTRDEGELMSAPCGCTCCSENLEALGIPGLERREGK